MTASSQEDRRASEAVAAGMAAAQAHDTAAQAQHATAGSAVVVEQAQTPRQPRRRVESATRNPQWSDTGQRRSEPFAGRR
jgi:hypothetical protein